MNKLYLIGVLLLSISFSALAENRIAFVDQQKLLEKAPQAEAARNKLQKEFAKRDKGLVNLQKKIKAKTQKLQKDGALMSNAALIKLKRETTSLRRNLERDKEDFRQDLTIRQNEELVKLQKVVIRAITAVAESKKYDLIVSDGVIYASKKIDITGQILNELKKAYKAK